MSSDTTSTATVKTVEHGDASTLPDISWTWRRWYIFLLTGALCLITDRISERLTDVSSLREIARGSLIIIFLLVFVYIAGATATDVVQLVTALRSTRKETVTTAEAPAVISTAEAHVESA